MSDVNSALEELENLGDATALPKKKKSYLPGFSGLDAQGKRNMIILIMIVLIVGYFIFSSMFQTPATQVITEETTGDEFASAAIRGTGQTVSTASTNQDLIAQAREADSQEAQYGVENEFSGLQNVEFGNWLTVKKEEPSSNFNPPLPNRMSDDNAFAPQQQQRVSIEQITQSLTTSLNAANQLTKTATPIQQRQFNTALANTANQTVQNSNRATPEDMREPSVSPESGLRHLLPGDTLVCQLVKAIDSDVSRETYCLIHGTALDGGRITLTVKREEDYVFLEGTNLVYRNKFVPLSGAIAVDTGHIAANGMRDSVDYHRLMRFSALMLAGAGSAVTNLVGQPRTRTTTSATQTTVETIKASESEIITAALARPAEIATENLLEVYNTPPTVYLEQNKIIHVYFSQPVTAPWMPDLRTETGNSFRYRLY